MSSPVQPVQPPNVEMELAKLANDAMQNGADPHDTTAKLHDMISYLRAFPKMAEHATNALADGVASPADITRTLYPHAQGYATAQRSSVQPTDAEAANLPPDATARSRFGGGLAAFASGIPGGEALTTGVHALAQGESWDQSRKDVRAAISTSPIRTPLKIAGAITAMKPIPGSVPLQAARYGLAEGVSSPDAMPLDQRLKKGATEGVVDAATASVLNGAFTGLRAMGPVPGKIVSGLKKVRGAADDANYGAAESEAAAGGGTSPEIQAALNHPLVKPLADDIRASHALQGKPADDASVLMQAHRELSQNERALIDRSAVAANPRPLTDREKGDVGAIKEMLRVAASDGPSALMPSFRKAVSEHAQNSAPIEAVRLGTNVANRVVRGTPTAAKDLGAVAKDPTAFADAIQRMKPNTAGYAATGMLRRAGQDMGMSASPKALFGLVPSLRALRVAPYVNQLDQQAGNLTPDALRRLGVASTDELYANIGMSRDQNNP